MATCHRCGYELEPGAKACRSCATPVPSGTPPVAEAPAPSLDAGVTNPVGVTPPPGAPPPPPPAAAPPPPGAPRERPAGRPDPRVWWIGGLGALILGLAVVLVVVLTSGGSSPRPAVTTTSTSSSPPPTAPQSPTPTASQIAQQLGQTRDPGTGGSFQKGDVGTIPDGAGGMLTAVSGFDQSVNHPPCLVFFWHDDTFVGTDSTQSHMGCLLVSRGNGGFVVNYEVFAPTDPLCCPSGADDVTYTWNGRTFVSNGAPPPSQ